MTDDANTKTHHQNIQSHIVNPSDVIYTRFEVKKMTLSETLTSVYENRNLIKAVFSSRRKKSEECRKVTVKPLLIKGEYIYQAEYTYEKRSYTKTFRKMNSPFSVKALLTRTGRLTYSQSPRRFRYLRQNPATPEYAPEKPKSEKQIFPTTGTETT